MLEAVNADLETLFDDGAVAKGRLLLLDYDGTLVPFASRPELAAPDSELVSLLEALSSRVDTTVHIVSGRPRESLGAWLGHLEIGLHAEHGYWTRGGPRDSWVPRGTEDHRTWMIQASVLMEAVAVAVAGTFIERKSSSLAFHYRNSDLLAAAGAVASLRASLAPLAARYGLDVLDGIFVLELRQGRANKGHVARALIEAHRDDGHVIAIGDDVTDEDMFAVLPTHGIAIAAGPRALSPRHRLDGPRAVRTFLQRLCAVPASTIRIRAVEQQSP